MTRVELFSVPGCSRCARTRDGLKAVARSLDSVSWREVDILAELDYAVELGVLSTPAIAIDGVLVFPALPSADRLRDALLERLGRTPRGAR